jgi:hypothetical protein
MMGDIWSDLEGVSVSFSRKYWISNILMWVTWLRRIIHILDRDINACEK